MKKILIMTIGLWCLTSCTQEENDAARMLEVSAEIAPQIATRTTAGNVGSSDYDKLTFDSSDEILIKKNNETAVVYTKGTSTWKPKAVANLLTTNNDKDVFTAFYPMESMDIQEDQTSYAGFWKSKQLTSKGVLNGNKVTFSFAPTVAKISVVVSYDVEQTTVTASVTGIAIRGGNDSQTIKLLKTDVSANQRRYSFASVIAPGSYSASAYTITLTAAQNGTKKYVQTAALTLKAGFNYQYTFTSTNELILTGVTVLPFSDQPEEDSGSAT